VLAVQPRRVHGADEELWSILWISFGKKYGLRLKWGVVTS
jgi:hypothetical protein